MSSQVRSWVRYEGYGQSSIELHTSAANSAPMRRSQEEAVSAADTGVAGGIPAAAGPRARGPRGDGVLNPASLAGSAVAGDSGPGPGGDP